jgi:hypothetical protein
MDNESSMPESDLTFERTYRDSRIHIRMILENSHRLRVTFIGKGTNDGTRVMMRYFDEVIGRMGAASQVCGLMDLRQLSKSPILSQVMLGKWLLKNKDRVKKIAIFGAKPWERRISKAIMKLARMERADFFKSEPDAMAWLEKS